MQAIKLGANKIEASQIGIKDKRVLVADPISSDGIKLLEQEVTVEVAHKLSISELKARIEKADGLVVRSETKVVREVIDAAEKLKVIARAGVGTDNIDVEAATRQGIVVINSPEGNTISAAEHTMALILSLVRKIPGAHQSLTRGEWNRNTFVGYELYNKTLGIIGFGKIGRAVAERGKGFQMRIVAYDPFLTLQHAKDLGVELVRLSELLEVSDIITIHVPLTKETTNLIATQELSKLKKGAFIVNCARGGIVDEDALYQALTSGHIGGAALDVFSKEPPTGSSLLQLPNVVLTPHLGASTKEAQSKVAVDVVEQLLDVLKGKSPRSAVNIPYLPLELAAYFEPYFVLAEKMGSLLAQLLRGPVSSIEITYQGEVAQKDVTVLTNAAIKGLLSHELSESVNFVNASWIARARGIKVVEQKNAVSEVFTSLITLQVVTTKTNELRSCAGTLFGGREPRIVQLEGYNVDVLLSGCKLITWQTDTPGVVGRVGMLLGQHDINIAEMQVGREKVRGRAVMVLSIDELLSKAGVMEVCRLEGIDDAMVVTL